jgi:hypothetical protein
MRYSEALAMAEPLSAVAPLATPAATSSPLAALQELPLPDPVPYTPHTVSWWIVAALLLLLLAFAVWRWARHRRSNRYRVEALRELADIEQALGENLDAARRLPALVKRVALASAPREVAAALSGDTWLQWLEHTLPQAGFLAAPGQLLSMLAYGAPQVPDSQAMSALLALLRRWIRDHRVYP